MKYFIKKFEETIKSHWNAPALNDYQCEAITYGKLAEEIEKMHLVWKAAGLQQGDKISLNARSSSNWAITFMAATSGGYVSCQLFNGFTPADTQKMVNHSDSKILFTEKAIFNEMQFDEMPAVIAVIDMKSMELLASRGNFNEIYSNRDKLFATAYPETFTPNDVEYPMRNMEDLCCINYTSGSTGTPKGVMLTVLNISSNIELIPRYFPYKEGDKLLSILPYAHIFGMLYDMATSLCLGMHLTVLGMLPAPSILKKAMQTISPSVTMMVPLILKKTVEYAISEINSDSNKKLEKDTPEYYSALREKILSNLGGNIKGIITGGAAMPEELEKLLVLKLKLPMLCGYGMTECGPTISLSKQNGYILKSCGILVDCMQMRIVSDNTDSNIGEIQLKGLNVFAGYYKNPEANKEAFTNDGWFRTGDLGTIDENNAVFIVGRNKSMLLGSNGENVYPEEIEVILNTLPYVAESIIVQRQEKLIALIVPNQETLTNDNISEDSLKDIMQNNIKRLNCSIPAFAKITDYELQNAAFAKTPKGSIKRFMYL